MAGPAQPGPRATASGLGTDVNVAERASALALGWSHMYTRRLPSEVAEIRRAELASDVWEQRADGRQGGVAPTLVALDILRRMLAGVPADVSWRRRQLTAVRHGHRERIDGRMVMVHNRTPLTRAQRLLTARRCKACGERYRRKLPYCPVCKTRRGHDGIKHDPKWASGGFL